MARSCHHVGEDAGPLCPLPSAHLSWLECGLGCFGVHYCCPSLGFCFLSGLSESVMAVLLPVLLACLVVLDSGIQREAGEENVGEDL